ncbi:type II toxin-antitoxin system RelE/ParE family toxin [Corallococcus sp. CA049B]|uniref:type II toxin-antitoxin system RelE family toxin n=1 Tax=Corallococcus sp. CA049B TaxID=2316730 RepID=UPI000EA31F66|nr:type II toxin-antitoxin system RelE/ParE family toxin [Corallococcus sp. CA049B]RKG78842.1 type II toxin-antitoxin system RelE/ParE family toxin [Corallococcus sp. CA049B]
MSTKPSATYAVEFLQTAVKQLAAVDPVHQRRIAKRIDALATEPRPVGAEKLKGSDYLRIRIGDYRVIYQIEDGRLVVLIVELGHRREIYR